MIELKDNELVFRFPEVHQDAVCRVDFQRTLRLPDDNNEYPLPPGLGSFHLEHIEDHASKFSSKALKRGGVGMPMYQAEALWINFSSDKSRYPFAIKIAAGKINAVTGSPWSNNLNREPQDYVVAPDQPWLDGFSVQEGLVRQFVAMPLGEGYTAEEQITGESEFGGLQIIAYPMKREFYEKLLEKRKNEINQCFDLPDFMCQEPTTDFDEMGLAPGGLMQQEIYEDDYEVDCWDTENFSRTFVHIMNSEQWLNLTGQQPPRRPPSAKDYNDAGLPWFDYYSDGKKSLQGSTTLAGLSSIAAKKIKKGEKPLSDNYSIQPLNIEKLKQKADSILDGD